MRPIIVLVLVVVSLGCSASFAADATTRAVRLPATQPLARQQWGAPLVDVAGKDGVWTIRGQKQTVTLRAADLGMNINAGPATWTIMPSAAGDLRVRVGSKDFSLRLAGAKTIDVEPYDTGYKTGVK
jgi:hypothetical protein